MAHGMSSEYMTQSINAKSNLGSSPSKESRRIETSLSSSRNKRIFRGPTYSAVMAMVRDELGPDAMILSSRLIAAPHGGVESRPWVELHAAAPREEKLQTSLEEHLTNTGRSENPVEMDEGWRERNEREDALELKVLRRKLLEQEVRQSLVDRLMKRVKKRLPYYCGPRRQGALHLLLDELASLIRIWEAKEESESHRFTCLVGRSGVGKTTLLSKLAISAALKDARRVALIQAGRGKKIDQTLKVSTAVLECPLRVVDSAEELGRSLTELSAYTDVYIDVPGINPFEDEKLKELKALLAPAADIEIHLVLNSMTRDVDILKSLEGFGCLKLSALAFTRLDEAATYGGLLNASNSANLPLSFFGFGAEVPTNFEPASKERVMDLLLMLSESIESVAESA